MRQGIIIIAAVLLVWWLPTDGLHRVAPGILPGPAETWGAFREGLTNGTLWANLVASLERLVIGYAGASLLGLVVGMAMGLFPRVGAFLEPLFSFFSTLSGIAWLPIAITWFGVGQATVLFVLANSIFFIVAANTLLGVQAVPRVYEHAVATLGGTRWTTVMQVLLPGALPSILSGLRLAMGFGWRALIAAEMAASAVGLGYMIFNASYDFRSSLILIGILVIGVVAMAIDQLIFAPVERRTVVRWGMVHEVHKVVE